uniref:P3 protein n=1 Tax=Phocoena sinus TaxID=42100 RepID=A0A8C9EF28_PHOSS
MGAAEWHSRANARPSVSIPRLAARGAAKSPNSGLPDPALLGSQLLTFTSHLPLCVPSLLRKSSAIKEGRTGPGLAHGPFSGQPDGTRRAALLSRRGPGLPTFWEEPWCLEGRRYLSIGDGSVTEFEFPEESEGIIVVSSQYPGQGNGTGPSPVLRVTSLDTELLTIKNLLDPCEAPPTLVEERRDFCIKVSRAEDPAALGTDLAHFSENPVLYLLLPLIFVNKCSFGCKVELEVLKGLLQSPQPMLLGLLGQFLVMPFYAFLMAKVFMLPKALALGLIITCSSPGGGGSYLFSLLLGGDVTLAISMTFISTVAATGFLPLSSAIYSRLLSSHETLHVPISKILGTLLFIAIPIAAGVLIRSKLPRFSQLLLQVIKPFSFVLLLGGLFLACHMGVFILAGVRLPIVLVGLTVPPVGLLVGYCLATCLKLPVAQRRTVSIEVGVQNSLLALAMLQLSLRRLQADYASQAPFLVALSGTSEMLALVTGHFIYSSVCAVP